MSDSNAELREFCLREAKDADPARAEFLLQLARNYEAAERTEGLSIAEALYVGLVLFVLCLPIFWLAASFDETARLPPEPFEQIQGFEPQGDGWYAARMFRFVREQAVADGKVAYRDFTKPMPLIVYEDSAPMPETNFRIQTLTDRDVWRYAYIKTSDGTDPRKNGRRYYVVMRD
jgi:hypothetical protein